MGSSERLSHSPAHLVALVVGLFCLWATLSAGRAGLSRLVSAYGGNYGSLAWANEGVNLSPSDPDAYYARAYVLEGKGEFTESAKELERAIALRPRDYFLWLELGRVRDKANDEQGALTAMSEAVRLAPYYAEPRWQLGNVLLRAGRRDEAFAEFRRATTSDPELLDSVIDMAWGVYGKDSKAVQQVLQPQTATAHLALARFFVKHEKLNDAVSLFRAAGRAADSERLDLVVKLLGAKQFAEAYNVWASGHVEESSAPRRESGSVAITDGGFEAETIADSSSPGFGWEPRDVQAVRVFSDKVDPRVGARSLSVEWSGNSNPSIPVISQLVLVEPKTRYQLNFATRTRDLITGGLPMIAVFDASRDGREVTQSALLPQGTNPWRDYKIEFVTSDATRAVRISIKRQNCNGEPCPIFGQAWFDAFSLQKL